MVFMPILLLAMPLKPGLEGQLQGVNNVVWPTDLNTYKRPVRNPGMRGIVNGPSTGYQLLVPETRQASVVTIQYPDQASQYPVSDFQAMLFGTWSSGSAHDYYDEVSYGNFDLTGTVSGWHTADNNRSYYGYANGFARAADLVKEAAQKSDLTVDYSQYDYDNDGYVDLFTVIHSGYGREETGSGQDIHSHSWSLSSAGVGEYTTNDSWPGHAGQFIRIDDYTIDPERSNVSNYGSMVCIGVFCHEWGHALGLPDLYDTDYSGSGIGYWGIMASGSWGGNGSSTWSPAHMCAWSKMDLGWVNPVVVDTNGMWTVNRAEDNPEAYQLWTDGSPAQEYFLVENRQKTGFDGTLIGSGFLICHIDETIINANRNSNTVNSGSTYGVAVEQADGQDHLFSGTNRGDAGDPFPGIYNNTAFDSTGTNPDSRSNADINTHCGVNQIPASADPMIAHFYINDEPTPQPPVADFSGTPRSGVTPLNVTFTDLSTGDPDSWDWDFGDGRSSTTQNPMHSYDAAGTYTVTLIASNAEGSDTATKQAYIVVSDPGQPPVADFDADPKSGVAPLSVNFTDLSTGGPTSWSWDFGDGNTSTSQNPVHNYTAAGTYDVSLTATNAQGTDTETKAGFITVTSAPQPPVAEFSATPTSGPAPLVVNFTDLSTGAPTSWSWDLGDGSTTSTLQNPSYTYANPGTYTVSLTATNAQGSDTETKSDYVTVTSSGPAPVASFTLNPSKAYVPLTRRVEVQFTDQSTGSPTSWSWDFGDGSAPSLAENPTHAYTSSGTFTVWLRVSNANGTDSTSDSVVIAVRPQDFFASAGLARLNESGIKIHYGVPVNAHVWLSLYDVNGQLVRTMFSGDIQAGEYTVIWDMRDEQGILVAPGVYFVHLKAPQGNAVGKILITN